MSEKSTLLTQQHVDYIADRTTPEDEFLRDLKKHARAAEIPAIWIAPEQAAFMQILLRSIAAREVIEIGTLAGYSAIIMARARAAEGRLANVSTRGFGP